jgi:membrane protein
MRAGDLLRAAWVEYERDRARYLAAAMVFYAMMSLVPLLLLLLAGLGLLLRFSAAAGDLQGRLLHAVGEGFGPELAASVNQLLDTLRQQSIVATVLGLAVLAYTASKLFRHLRMSFRAVWKHEAPLVSGPLGAALRATLAEYAIAFGMVLGGGGLLLAALVLLAVAQWADRLLGDLPLPGEVGRWLVMTGASLLIAAATFAALLKILPPVAVRWRDLWLPALLCALAWVIAGELLALYTDILGDSRSAYGALGGLLAVMLLMNAVSKALFLAAELCKILAGRRAATGNL